MIALIIGLWAVSLGLVVAKSMDRINSIVQIVQIITGDTEARPLLEKLP